MSQSEGVIWPHLDSKQEEEYYLRPSHSNMRTTAKTRDFPNNINCARMNQHHFGGKTR